MTSRNYSMNEEDIAENIIQSNGLELVLHLEANRWNHAAPDEKKNVDEAVKSYLSSMRLAPAAIGSYYRIYQSKKKKQEK